MFSEQDEFDILDPTPTAWNRLTRPGSGDRPDRPGQRSLLDSPSGSLTPELPGLEMRSRAVPHFPHAPTGLPVSSSPSSSLDTPTRTAVRQSPLISVVGGGVRGSDCGAGDVGAGGSGGALGGRRVAGDSSELTLTIYDENGSSFVVPVVTGINTNARAIKPMNKKVISDYNQMINSSMKSVFRSLLLRLDPRCWICRVVETRTEPPPSEFCTLLWL